MRTRILRGLAGVAIGVLYGSLVTVLVFMLTRISLPEHEEPTSLIMMDSRGLALLGTILAGLITTVCGVLVGLIVGLTGATKRKAAMIALVPGLFVIGLLLGPVIGFVPQSFKDVVYTVVTLIIFPGGLVLTAWLVALIGDRLKSYDL